MTTTSEQPSFDAQAAEEELDRLRLEIGATRRRREQAVADFEAFLRNTRAATERRGGATDAAATGPYTGAPPALMPTLESVVAAQQRPRIDFGVFDEIDKSPARSADSARSWQRREWLGLGAVAGIVAISVLASVWALSRWDAEPTPAASDSGSAATMAPAPTAGTQSPAGVAGTTDAGSDLPVDGRALRVEMLTVDDVWLRVQVDGQQVIAREIPAGQRLRYAADREVVVRAGNAGAVRVKVGDGAELALGRTGQVVTRTFTAPAR